MAKAQKQKQKFEFRGEITDHSVLVGSHGDVVIRIDGNFDLSGIIYCPRYTVTITVRGEGRAAFRGKCNRIVIKKIKGASTLDLSELTCRELQCRNLKEKAMVIAGKTRVISRANLADEAELHLEGRPLITNSFVTGNARVVYRPKAPADNNLVSQ